MTQNSFASPLRVFQQTIPPLTIGWSARNKLPAIVDQIGQRVLVVSDPGVSAQPMFRDIVQSLQSGTRQVLVFDRCSADPPLRDFVNCAEQAKTLNADLLIGIGGGSALDVTKIASVLAKYSVQIEDLFGIGNVPGRGIPTILLPTTAGTGSEVTPIAVASDEENLLKKGIVSDYIVADRAIIDPELCVTLPPWPTAYTGMDALTHAIEAFTNKFAVPLIDCFALEAIQLVAEYLPCAVADGTDREARYAMSRASMLGGLCLGPVNTAAVHAMAYPLGGRFKVPHGIANSLLLPHVMQFNLPAAEHRYSQIAKAMRAKDPVDAVEKLSTKVGTNKQMRDYGVSNDDLQSMAEDAVKVIRLMNNNPRSVSAADAFAIYQKAL